VQVSVPAIIADDVFQAVQDQLMRDKALAQRNRKYDYLFVGGRLHCGRCGRAMTGEAPHGVRRYRCSSRNTFTDPSKRCKGYVSANDAEERVWHAIEHVLQQPDLIAAEVHRQQAGAEEQRMEVMREISLLADALAKCDREEQRWAEAYIAEVINLGELKGYRAEITARRESILTQHQHLQTKLDTIGQAVEHVEALIGYCERVRQKLQTFDAAEKRLAFEALNVRVTWTPGQPLAIEGTIPLGEIVPLSLELQESLLATGRVDDSGAATVAAEELPDHLPGDAVGRQAGMAGVQGAHRIEGHRLVAEPRQGRDRWQQDIHHHGRRPSLSHEIDGATVFRAVDDVPATPKVVIPGHS
jgi:hypothetical protein